jgi:hypothetical protein
VNDDTQTQTPDLESISEIAAEKSGLNRRGFIAAAGAFSAAAFIAACGSSSGSKSKDTTTTGGAAVTTTTAAAGGGDTTTTAAKGSAADDLKVGAFAASLEVLAVATYGAALTAATGGKLGTVPPAVAEFVTTAKAHHQAALDAWNKVLTTNGQPAVTMPPKALAAKVNAAFAKVTDAGGAAKLANSLEATASATYLKAIPTLFTPDAIKLASSIQIIDMQHQAILNFALGMYPVPNTFASTKEAATPE